jgi:5-methylcytosine-specific restriction enzyme A
MTWSNTSRHARGYGTAWDKLRLRILKRDNYLCHCPRCQGGALRLTTASEVDHIVPKAEGGTDDQGNLRAVNSACHRILTIEQAGKTPQPRVRTGLDGWPVNSEVRRAR